MLKKFIAFATAALIAVTSADTASALPKSKPGPGETETAWYFATPEEAHCAQGDAPVAVRLETQTFYSSEQPEYTTYRRYACTSVARNHGFKNASGTAIVAPFRPVRVDLRIQAAGAAPFVPRTITLRIDAAGKPPFVPVSINLNIQAHGSPLNMKEKP